MALTRIDYLELLEGEEVLSVSFEGCVGVRNGQVIQGGEIVDENPSLEILKTLFDEAFEYEFGGLSAEDLLNEEFGNG